MGGVGRAFFFAVLAIHLMLEAADAGIGKWTTGGPEGGWINAVATDPQTAEVVYVASREIFKSFTNGSFWTRVLFPGFNVAVIAVDPRTPAVLYTGTGQGVCIRGGGAVRRRAPVRLGEGGNC